MKQHELQAFLSEVAADRVALVERHEAGARAVAHYDFNNTYQYVINREETHLTWLRTALAEVDTPMPAAASHLAVPAVAKAGKAGAEPGLYRGVLEDDARHLAAFVAKWRPRVQDMTHARHRTMLNVVLGESAEHQRLFEQAAAGMEDLLGRRTGGVARQGGVLPARWME
ncbi:MAG: hypothetical protein HOP14_09500 [Acidobacteria bacterium]|nr:hypothetical protein [Acidobacteriota bacterium]